MRSLFLRIFLWFWLTISVIGMTTVLLTFSEESGPALTLWRSQVGNALGLFGQAAVSVWTRQGRPGLDSLLHRLEESGTRQAYLFDARGVELSGRSFPEEVERFAERVLAEDKVTFEFAGDTFLAGLRIQDAKGRSFALVQKMPRRPLWYLLGKASPVRDILLRLAMMLTVVGVLSYGLARYLTRPILGLQGAVRRFAGGDLDVRVGPSVQDRKDEIGQLGRDFDHMAERIESLVRAQQRLLGDISHELRSPLARLYVALELARKRTTTEAQPALDRIEREAERLNELIGQLLTLVRLESGSETVERGPVDLSALVRQLARDVDFEAAGRHCSVAATIADRVVVLGNEELLRRALENVLRNAIRYTAAAGSVELELAGKRIEDRWWAEISIRDHGPGVPESALGEMFQAFRRVGDARERDSGGVGLGLSIAEQAVRAHQGVISAENATDGGLRVVIRLPVAKNGSL